MTRQQLEAQAKALIAKHPEVFAQIRQDLTNFYIPAQRSINFGFAKMGVDRFTPEGDDVWEMMMAIDAGWEYTRPPANLVERWRCA